MASRKASRVTDHLLLPCVAGLVRLIDALVSTTNSSTAGNTSGSTLSSAQDDWVSSAAARMSKPVISAPADAPPVPEPEEAPPVAALALAPGSGLDGFLTAGDLAGLKLNAELVVLSGCRTAGGVVIAGEGIQGLTAPLLAAGSRRVLATGWRIRDGDAARFMEYFYRELPVDGEVGAALRRAKLAARSDGMTAAVWGAFVLAGDPLGGFVPRPVKASVSGR